MIPISRVKIPLVEWDPLPTSHVLNLERVLFLDFDGVLHPESCAESENFCYVPLLQAVMEKVDPDRQLPIVISSLWRHHRKLSQLRAYFPLALALRIVGVTPYMDEAQVAHVENWDAYGGAESRLRHRQREVVMWMNTHAPNGKWLAIDDRAEYFHKDTPHLFLVPKLKYQGDSGITESFAPALEARLRTFLNGLEA